MKISDTPVFKTFFCKPPIPYFTTPTFLWEKSEHPRFKKFFRAQTFLAKKDLKLIHSRIRAFTRNRK